MLNFMGMMLLILVVHFCRNITPIETAILAFWWGWVASIRFWKK